MSFIKYYIFFSIWGLTILTTFSLRTLFNESYEKIGLALLWLVLIFSAVFNINKLDLLWLAPLSLVIPYFIYKIVKILSIKRFGFVLKYFMNIFF